MHRFIKTLALVLLLAAIMVAPALADDGTVTLTVNPGTLHWGAPVQPTIALGSLPFLATAQTTAWVTLTPWQVHDDTYVVAHSHKIQISQSASPIALWVNGDTPFTSTCTKVVAGGACTLSGSFRNHWGMAPRVVTTTPQNFAGWQDGTGQEIASFDYSGMKLQAAVPGSTLPGAYSITLSVVLVSGPVP